MSARPRRASEYVLRPVTVLSMVWFTLVALRFLWLHLTATVVDGELRFIEGAEFWGATAVQACLLVALGLELRRVWGSAERRAHLAGLGLGLVTLGFVQWGLSILVTPIPF